MSRATFVNSSATLQTSKKLRVWEKALFTLIVANVVLPTAAQSIASGIFFFWFLGHRAWRVVDSLPPMPGDAPPAGYWGRLRDRFPEFWCLFLGVAACTATILVAYVAASAEYGPLQSWGGDFSKSFRLAGKQGIYGCLTVLAILMAKTRGWRLERALPWVAGIVAVNAAYMLVQRYTGIDWVHGWHAKIPANRFAYGVFRPAGLLSHPLSMAYNNLLFGLMAYAYGFRYPIWPRATTVAWRVIFACMAVMLILTGSRWPLLVMVVVIAAAELPRLRGYYPWMLGGIALLAVGLYLEGNIVGRFREVFQTTGTWSQRIPRLAFWQVHWQMFLDNPLTGQGLLRAEAIRDAYYQQMGLGDLTEKYNAHNIYLQTLADLGLVGFAGLFALMFGCCRAALLVFRERRDGSLLLVMAGLLLGGLMQNTLRDHEVLYCLWITFAMADWGRMPEANEVQWRSTSPSDL